MRWWALELDDGYTEPFHDYTLGCQCPACRGVSAVKCVSTSGVRSLSKRKAAVRGRIGAATKRKCASDVRLGRASICPACGAFTVRPEGMCERCEKTR